MSNSNPNPADEADLNLLRNTKVFTIADFDKFVAILKEMFQPYGRVWEEEGKLMIATGGWSENEAAMDALQDNALFWAMFWEASRRGGLFIFRRPIEADITTRRG